MADHRPTGWLVSSTCRAASPYIDACGFDLVVRVSPFQVFLQRHENCIWSHLCSLMQIFQYGVVVECISYHHDEMRTPREDGSSLHMCIYE